MNKKLIKFHDYWLKFQSRKFSYADYNVNYGQPAGPTKPGELSVTKTEVLNGQLAGPNKNQEQHLNAGNMENIFNTGNLLDLTKPETYYN